MLDAGNEIFKNARILIVDDQEANVRLLQRILVTAGYRNLKSTCDSRRVLALYAEFQPDVILLDLHMTYMGGLEVLKQLRSRIPEEVYLPVLVLTADILPETKKSALSSGAKDFLTKPFDSAEVVLRIQNLLETRFLYLRLVS